MRGFALNRCLQNSSSTRKSDFKTKSPEEEPAGFAGEGKECVEAAVLTADAGDAAFEGAAVERFV